MVNFCYAVVAVSESCGLLGPLISHDCQGAGDLPSLKMV
jgi:hypothetical protein